MTRKKIKYMSNMEFQSYLKRAERRGESVQFGAVEQKDGSIGYFIIGRNKKWARAAERLMIGYATNSKRLGALERIYNDDSGCCCVGCDRIKIAGKALGVET